MKKIDKIIIFAFVLSSLLCRFNFSVFAESNEGGRAGAAEKEGKKIYVPEDYKTIKEALENSDPGDKIYVAAGKYEEKLGIRLKPEMGIYGKSAGETEIAVGGIGVLVESGNVVADIAFKLDTGQVLFNAADSVTLRNCLISGNGGGNGVFIEKSEKVDVVNCTIANFTSGIYIRFAPCGVSIRNCIISNNRLAGISVSNEQDKGIYFSSITGKPTEPKKKGGGEIKVMSEYNDIWGSSQSYCGISAGKSDISKDPKFVDVSKGDYHLRSDSPCIHAGDPDKKYNNPDGTRNDIGALSFGH